MKGAARSLLRRLGYEARRLPSESEPKEDYFLDQKALLHGRDVRMILDVGANRGQSAVRYLALFPGATVHSFEPFPASFDALVQATPVTHRFKAHRLAIAADQGEH